MEFHEILETLCNEYGISGNESAVASRIIGMIEDYADSYRVDDMGNVIVFKKGAKAPKKKILIDAHTDEVGMIVTGFASDGGICFTTVGGVDARVILGRKVLVGEDRIPGVIGTKAIHMQSEEERKTAVSVDKLYIDIGCSTKEEVEALVEYGDEICFPADFGAFGNGCWKGKAIDDRFGCAVMVELIRSELPCDCWFSFSVQEEVGCRGAAGSAFSVAPDYAIALEATTAADLAGVSEPKNVCSLGKGAVVGFMDRGTIYPRDLYKLCHQLGAEKGIPVQTKTMVAGGNDARSIHQAAGGVKTIAVSAPCRYLHSPYCVVKDSDLTAVRDLTRALIEKLGEME